MEMPKLKISKDQVGFVKGLSICLLALLIMLSGNVPGLSWIATGILASFGFIGFWILVPAIILVGIYVMIYKKIAKKGIGISLIGLFIIVAFLGIMSTNFLLTNISTLTTGGMVPHSTYLKAETPFFLNLQTETLADGTVIKHYLEIDSAIHYFQQVSATTSVVENFHSNGGYIITNSALGGGFLGFFFAGMANSAFTPNGTTALCIIMMVVGTFLVFNIQVRKIYRLIVRKIKGNKSSEEYQDASSHEIKEENHEVIPSYQDNLYQSEQTINMASSEENISLEESNIRSAEEVAEMNSFNESHTLRKAHFSTEMDASNPIVQENRYNNSLRPASAAFGANNDLNTYHIEETPKQDEHIILPDEEVFEPTSEPVVEEEAIATETTSKPEVSNEISATPVDDPLIQKKAKPLLPYFLPSLDNLELREKAEDAEANTQSCNERVNQMNNILQSLNLGAQVTGYTVGPSVTRYDLLMNSDKSITTMERFITDFSIRLGGIPIRFEKVVSGKSTSGLEMENSVRTIVGLRECLEKMPPVSEKTRTLIPFGKNITGEVIYADLTKFPHMLVAGTTGSGKSVFIHSLIITLLMRNRPEELKLVLIDPKKVEMARYKDLPHLLCPNISEAKEANVAFRKLVDEMEFRYELLAKEGVSDIKDYNEIMKEKGLEKLPYIVCIVDEYADLSEQCKEIREPIHRIAQKARAAGIHLVLATQRPSVDVIDGVLKANISTRVALMVGSYTDSTVILGEGGAEKLLPNGDMIVDSPVISRGLKPRVQGAYCSSSEIIKVIRAIKDQMGPMYDPKFLDLKDHEQEKAAEEALAQPTKVDKDMAEEQLYEIVKEDIMHKEFCSISYIQRSYGVGFPKAGRLFGRLQKEGYVELSGDAKGCKVIKRAVEESSSDNLGSVEQSTLVMSDDNEQ